MSEVYWIAGGRLALDGKQGTPVRALGWLEQASLRISWINEIHWLAVPPVSGAAPRWPGGPAAFTWNPQPLLDHALLHAASQAILTGERDLVLLGSEEQASADLVVLGSPQAVGRYNILPRARLAARFSIPVDSDDFNLASSLSAGLKKLGLEPESIGLLAAAGESARLTTGTTAGWGRVEAVPGGALAMGAALIGALQESGVERGLLASLASQGPALVTLVERI